VQSRGLIQAAQTESEATRDEPYSGRLHGQRPECEPGRPCSRSGRRLHCSSAWKSRGTRTMSGAAEVRRTLKLVQRALEANVDRLPTRAPVLDA
jgi:hypothetical protein